MSLGKPYDVEFRKIRKTFDTVLANDGVSFGIHRHSIHGVVGENGAGKSTIMKILYGMYRPDSGEIVVRGDTTRIRNPEAAIRLGIGMVHQHFMLVPTLTVWQNVILGNRGLRIDENAVIARLGAVSAEFGFSLALDAVIEDLSVGEQQQVELLKLLYHNSEILILDEPTAVLTPQEVEHLFERLKSLWQRGKTIVLITHKLREILRFTQTVTIMRQGKVVETTSTSSLTEESLAEKIIGRRRRNLPERKRTETESIVLSVKEVHLLRRKQEKLRNLSFDVRAGEILGIAGVEGNGQHELVEVLAGVDRSFSGDIVLAGRSLHDVDTYAAKQAGLAVVPPDRHREGCILDFAVWENFILGHHREAKYARGKLLSAESTQAEANACLEKYDVRPRNTEVAMRGLSGGNQQKLVLGRELSGQVRLLIVAHPTRGVDIGAIEFIHSQFLKLRDEGTAILLISSDLDEILALSDRIAVLYEGRIRGETPRSLATESQLGLWMTGGTA